MIEPVGWSDSMLGMHDSKINVATTLTASQAVSWIHGQRHLWNEFKVFLGYFVTDHNGPKSQGRNLRGPKCTEISQCRNRHWPKPTKPYTSLISKGSFHTNVLCYHIQQSFSRFWFEPHLPNKPYIWTDFVAGGQCVSLEISHHDYH